MKSHIVEVTSIKRWCTKLTLAAVGYCTRPRTDRRRVFAVFSIFFRMPLCQVFILSVRTCGVSTCVELHSERGGLSHIFDRFHMSKKLNEKIERFRAEQAGRLKATGLGDLLKHAHWCLFKNPAHLTERQAIKLSGLVKHSVRSVRAYLMREDF